jgi:hypothetical protein
MQGEARCVFIFYERAPFVPQRPFAPRHHIQLDVRDAPSLQLLKGCGYRGESRNNAYACLS